MNKILSFMGAALIVAGLLQPVNIIRKDPVDNVITTIDYTSKDQIKPTSFDIAKTAVGIPTDNKSIAWQFLRQYFTPAQTAGIMGNLQQEHGFQTSDVPGGLGIAQWTGGRRTVLLSKVDPFNISTQLAFMMEELNGPYSSTLKSLKSATSIESATIIFQNGYEGCGVCMEGQRITYAQEIYNEYN